MAKLQCQLNYYIIGRARRKFFIYYEVPKRVHL